MLQRKLSEKMFYPPDQDTDLVTRFLRQLSLPSLLHGGCFEFCLLMFSPLLCYVARNFSFSSVKICNLILIHVKRIKTLLLIVRATFVVQNLKIAVGFFCC